MLPSIEEAIKAIKAGDKEKGRKLLADILQADLENEMAWLWMSSVATSNEERLKYLKRVLEINPDNVAAQRGLAKLKSKAEAAPKSTPAQPEKEISSRLSTSTPAQPKATPPPAPETSPKPVEPIVTEPPQPSQPMTVEPPLSTQPQPLIVEPPLDEPTQKSPESPPPSISTADDVMTQFRGTPPVDSRPSPAADEAKEDDDVPTEAAASKGKGFIDFLNSERGIFTLIVAAVAVVLALVVCVVINLVFQPLAQQLSPTVAAALGTDTPTATFTPVTPSATPTPSSTPTPTVTPTLTPSPPSTRVVIDTPTVTATPTRTATPVRGQKLAQVVGIVSGDTIAVIIDGQEELVKYLNVDAPAVNDPVLGTEPIGEEALAANRVLVEGKQVTLEPDISDRDERGRLLRYVFVDDLMINELLLQQGAARLNLTPPDTKYGARLQDAEQSARERGVGIWGLE